MTRQPPLTIQPAPPIETELERATRLGLILAPGMQKGVAENLRLLAHHYELVSKALSDPQEPAA